MKKLLLIFFGLMINTLFSQEIHSIYKFKIAQKKRFFYHYELDSLVLYKNGNFHRTFAYNYHEIAYEEAKGNWHIENGKLILNVNQIKEEDNWINSIKKYNYLLRRKKIVSIVEGDLSAQTKLRLISN